MKQLIILIAILNSSIMAVAQIQDSICIHTSNNVDWQAFRPIDSFNFAKYSVNSKYFKKSFRHDSLFIKFIDGPITPKTVFIGEYTNRDSIRFIDFIKYSQLIIPQVCFQGIYSNTISHNQLPQITKMELCNSLDSMKLYSYDLIIQHHSEFLTFKLINSELSKEIKNCIMSLRNDDYIVVDNIAVVYRNQKRHIMSQTFQVKD